MDKTLVIIKPDALMKKVAGEIIKQFEEEGVEILGAKLVKMTPEEAGEFYIEHREKPFYVPLTEFMSSNPCLAMVLGGKNIIERSREIIGSTDPAEAEEGTIRQRWASDGRYNVVHGSDSPQSALREIEFFFPSGAGIYKREPKEYNTK